MKGVFLDALKLGFDKECEDEQVDMSDFEISDSDTRLVDKFLSKFTIVTESSMSDHLDIKLLLKALPNKILANSINLTEMFNFRIF